MPAIKPMMKVKLMLSAGTDPDDISINMDAPEYEFIYGIGSGGLTPFEYKIAEMTTGDEMTIALQRSGAPRFFEHIRPPVLGLFPDCSELFVTAKITAIGPADDREIVKAMAEMTAHGEGGCACGGSCGCG